MTAKRFKIVQGYNDRYCQDTATNKLLNQNQTVEYLNNLCEENEQLKKENKKLKAFIKSLSDKNNEIWLDNGSIYRLRKAFKGAWVND